MAKTAYQVLQKAVTTYGPDEQMRMAQEECAELTVALSKYHRAETRHDVRRMNAAAESIIEEVTDVEIMCKQLHIIIGKESAFNAAKDFKIKRLDERISKVHKK
jgi:NTP pyrophosphatase (non-canonical NTP hydrolase)